MLRKRTYGPVPSRRFGLSLGVDVVPFKFCTLDCVYCQLGNTVTRSVQRQSFYPPEQILKDVKEALQSGPMPDIITFAGSGEPTLYQDLGIVARGVRELTDLPLLLITNGSLLYREDVARDAFLFDIVAPSLDAADPKGFQRINRPHEQLHLEAVVDGLERFSRQFKGRIHLEILFAQGYNDSPESLEALVKAVERIRPHQVDLNTVSRPAPSGLAKAVSTEFLEKAEVLFQGFCRRIPDANEALLERVRMQTHSQNLEERILETLGRRPCTVHDLAKALDASENMVAKCLEQLVARGDLAARTQDQGTFFLAH